MTEQLTNKRFISGTLNHIRRSIHLLAIVLIFFFTDLSLVSVDPPVLPSSFYGTVKVNGFYVAKGSIISARINKKEVASTEVQIFEGDSVYCLIIPGDEDIEEDDPINFYVDDVLADQTEAVWKSGTNKPLDLTVEINEEGYKVFLPLILH